MQIAHFVQRYPPALGGSEAYFARLSKYLAGAGEHVGVWTTTAVDLEAFWKPGRAVHPPGLSMEAGVQVRRYSLLRWPGRRYCLKPLSLVPHRLWQCLTLPCNPIAPGMWRDAGSRRTLVDVVHATAFPYAFPIACGLRLARLRQVPFLLTPFVHSGDPDDPRDATRRAYTQPALRYLLRCADRVFVQTESEHALVQEMGVASARLVRQGLGVEPGECTGGDRQRSRHAWGVHPDDVVVGHLANNSREKGTVDLLLAAQKLWARGRHFHVVLAGPQMANFRRFYQDLAPRGPVHLLGVLDDEEKKDFLAGLDVFALPSRSDSFGLVLLEAWANGLPNLAYRAGGVADVVRHEEDGVLVRCGDVEALSAALEQLVLDGERRQLLGRRGRARLHREFLWADKLALVRDVYADAVVERKRARREEVLRFGP